MSPTPAQVADLLDGGADRIEQHGWTREEFYKDWNDAADAPFSLESCPVCARGGISAAAGEHPEFAEDPSECAKLPLIFSEGSWCLAPEDQAKLDLIRAAEKAFATHLRNLPAEFDKSLDDDALIAFWNDDIAESADQVIAELRACATNLRKADGGEPA